MYVNFNEIVFINICISKKYKKFQTVRSELTFLGVLPQDPLKMNSNLSN